MRTSAPVLRGAHRALLLSTWSLAAALALAGCKQDETRAPTREQTRAPASEQKLTVFAASSLRDAFSAISTTFKTGHPEVEVTFNFAGSQELRAQIEQGSPADVFASADTRHMDTLVGTSRVQAPVLFAQNEPVVVVARESVPLVHTVADLPGLERIVLGAPEVPIGRYTQQILDRACATLGADFRSRVEAKVVSRELNVRQVLSKVSLGEAQAGIVYRSDVQSAKDAITTLTIPAEINVIADYPIAVVAGAGHPQLARAWVEHVLSSQGQKAVLSAGFLPASAKHP